MNFSHYSRAPIEAVRDGNPNGRGGAYKPAGLWLSVDGEDDWPAWCSGEGWCCNVDLWHYRVNLAADANVLVLSTADEVCGFGGEYGKMLPREFFANIDWPRVALQHDGVIIAPYQWDCRLDDRVNWYYTWDCASGVIWKARAIASIDLLGKTKFTARADEEEAA